MTQYVCSYKGKKRFYRGKNKFDALKKFERQNHVRCRVFRDSPNGLLCYPIIIVDARYFDGDLVMIFEY